MTPMATECSYTKRTQNPNDDSASYIHIKSKRPKQREYCFGLLVRVTGFEPVGKRYFAWLSQAAFKIQEAAGSGLKIKKEHRTM